MGAPAGNKYYMLRSSSGRDKEFKTPVELWDAFLEYKEHTDDNPIIILDAVKSGADAGMLIQIPHARPYTLKAFASYIGLTELGLRNYGTLESHKEFFTVYTRIKEITDNNKFEGAAVGIFNANIIARDLGLTDNSSMNIDVKSETKLTEQQYNELIEAARNLEP